MSWTAPPELAPEFRRLLAARRILGTPKLAEAQADPAAARVAAAKFIYAPQPAKRHDEIELSGTAGRIGYKYFMPSAAHRQPGTIFYLHGGGLVFHDLALFAQILSDFATISGRCVVGFDYPKAPETPPREIIAETGQALLHLAADLTGPLILVGDSVGGLLSFYFATTLLAGRCARLVLIYPVLSLADDRDFPSYERFGRNLTLDIDFMRWFRSLARAGLPDDFDPFCCDEQILAGLPETFIASAGCDMLSDEAVEFALRLRRAGVVTRHITFSELPHDFCLYRSKSERARAATQAIAQQCLG
jgi:acetyl esterase/lipase